MSNETTPLPQGHSDSAAGDTTVIDTARIGATASDTTIIDTARLDDLFPEADHAARQQRVQDPEEAPHRGDQAFSTAASPQPAAPTYLTGVAPTPVIIGLLGLLTLAGCAVWALADWTVNWAVAVPVGIVGLGLVIVVLGVAGLRRSRT